MKARTSFLFLSIFLIGIFSSFKAPNSTPVAQNGNLQVKGTQLTNQNGKAVVLRGVSFGWHCFHPRFYNSQAVNWLSQDWKVSVVRAAMGVGPDNSYLQNSTFAKQCVDNIVTGAIKNGIYVIIDFHSHKKYTTEAKAFFTEMATKYKDVPNVIYEIWNEPDYITWNEVKEYSEELITTIRNIDKDNIILVGSPHWNQDVDSVAVNPILGQKNIMYTMHFYAGTHKKELRDKTDAAIAKGIPIFISECAGMDATGDGELDIKEWNIYLNWMEKLKLSWVVWSLSDKNETCSMLTPEANAEGSWNSTNIKPWGELCKESIKTFNNH